MDELLMLAGGASSVRTVIDVGANDGADSLPFARRFPNIRFVAIEPTPDLARILEAESRALQNYTVVACAIGRADGQAAFKIRRSSLLNSLEEINRANVEAVGQSVEEYDVVDNTLVPVRTLRSLCAELGLEGIDVLHVDAQGSDMDVLVSAGEMLETVRAGLVEAGSRLHLYANTAGSGETVRFLTKEGFRVVRLTANDRFNFEQNIVFVRGSSRARNLFSGQTQMAVAHVSYWTGRRSPLVRFAIRAWLGLRRRTTARR